MGNSVAAYIARTLRARGVKRVFALCGGHIMPIWMRLDAEGITIVDVRDERAAVHMAQAHAELTGKIGVALATAGPGLTNAITGIANAHVSRAPVLVISGIPPKAQENRGALQDIDHTQLVRPITRYARTVREPNLVPAELDEALARALGEGSEPGPAFLDFPTDCLRAAIPEALQLTEHIALKPRPLTFPDPEMVAQATDLLWSARKPLVISGRGARNAGPELVRLLNRVGAAYLDTGESRGLVPDDHPTTVAAMRGRVMGDVDLVVTVGRCLDFQLAYGSPAIFGNAKFLRIADVPSELRDNRRGAVEVLANPARALAAMLDVAGNRTPAIDSDWITGLRAGHADRATRLRDAMANAAPGADGRMHPNRMLGALQDQLDKDSVVVIDGGDFLSFARVALSASTVLDPGPFGCIGVGVPYGIAAALEYPEQKVLVATGDGAFGFNAMEIDTAVRHKAPVVIAVANNGAWQVEVHDQTVTHGKVVGTRLHFSDYAAMARTFGMHGERVEKAEDLPDAIARAFANAPALLDVIVTPEAVSSDAKAGLAWVPDLQPLAVWDEKERAWRDT
ncbi:MAG: thiamine pyrophosphate-binding protein [Alphaproteobacteria bacterium]|jgi:acetolactate synthase-1/2/3 large subunit|nr:thiamine pyrophosphate-binding protein [Alphaproteobacteria bacterium]MDP6237525.1 thiamine pyrophosphate-binding protein [Alphaproteobacteria bacterium]MDP7172883.1 thiamine pyrophosphate-binding protein [Alphaproteobacteria bacterium]MDP7233067.1 thiamine pyrophosphate-binding protein [Alphaproteobacteria bacterium]HJN21802.1 thiamine pyrophosphate-binding protein [Alphaproteobacteria bacterium]|tara:strand:+ start:432 stop:2135 length:1704 start_codon:yes stop_codon:yes gene_type:complete